MAALNGCLFLLGGKLMIKPEYYQGKDGKDLFDRYEAGLLKEDEVIGFYKGNLD